MEQTIMFLFIQRSKVLLEYKKGASGNADIVQIPQGVIEERDRSMRHVNDEEHALNRLIYEQFAGTVIPLQYERIDTPPETGVALFFIYSWEGDHPLHETKKLEWTRKLRWFQIDDAIAASADHTKRAILKIAKEKIRIRSVLFGRTYRQ